MNFQAGGKSGVLFRTRKQSVVAVRLLLVAAVVVSFRQELLASGLPVLVLALLGVSNAVWWFVRRDIFETRRSYIIMLLLDVGLIGLLSSLAGGSNPEFAAAYLFIVLAAVLCGRLWLAVVFSVVACAAFAALYAYTRGPEVLLGDLLPTRLALLLVTGVFAGLIAEATETERRIAIWCNPTTSLPGYHLIRAELERRIESGGSFSVCYIDNDDFKAYNDHYGYARGDALIKATGKVISEAVREAGNADDFVGHVGGDDFIVVTTPGVVDTLIKKVKDNFARTVRGYYDTDALEQGFIKSHDRDGVTATFPVMSLSVAVISNERRNITNPDQIAGTAAELKKKAKSHKSRIYVTGDTTTMRAQQDSDIEEEA